MRLPRRAHDAMLERIAAYWQSQLVFVAAKLGVADVLVGGPLTAEEIATRVGAHAPYLKRVLRALASLGIFVVDPHGRFHLNRLAQTLRSDHPESLRDFALMLVDDYNWSAWGALEHAVRTGHSAFEHVHGAAAFPWMQAHPEKEKMFSASMASISVLENTAVARAYPFGKTAKGRGCRRGARPFAGDDITQLRQGPWRAVRSTSGDPGGRFERIHHFPGYQCPLRDARWRLFRVSPAGSGCLCHEIHRS